MISRIIIILSMVLASTSSANNFEAVYYTNNHPGKWKDGRITWYYNPAGKPSDIKDEDILATMTRAFDTWTQVCNITVVYGGITSQPATGPFRGMAILGWADGLGMAEAAAFVYSSDMASNLTYYTNGSVRINTKAFAFRDGGLEEVLTHELGHLLGLSHSEDPASIMFSGPGFAFEDKRIQGDDINACAALYGGKGLSRKASSLDDTKSIDGNFRLAIAIGAGWDISNLPTTEVVDLARPSHVFAASWGNVPIGTIVRIRLVNPTGESIMGSGWYAISTINSYLPFSIESSSNMFVFSGTWTFQLVRSDGVVIASKPFTVVGVPPLYPKLEHAFIAELAGDTANLRVENLSTVGILNTSIYANADYKAAISNFSVGTSSSNSFELWMRSSTPRYLPDAGNGQASTAFDYVRTLKLNRKNGALVPEFRFEENGRTNSSYATTQVSIPDTGKQNVYVAAVVGSQMLFKTKSGWSTTPTELFSVTGPAVAIFDVATSLNTLSLPANTTILVGYGESVAAVATKKQYKAVRVY